MPSRTRERKRDIEPDSRFRKQRKLEAAYKEARRRLSSKKHGERIDVGELATSLLKTKSDYLDRRFKRELGLVAERESKKARFAKRSFVSLGPKTVESLASEYNRLKERRADSPKEEEHRSSESPGGPPNKTSSDNSRRVFKVALEDVIRDAQQLRSERDINDTGREHSSPKKLQVRIKRDGSIHDVDKLTKYLQEEMSKGKQRVSFQELGLNNLDEEDLEKYRQATGRNKRILEDKLRQRMGQLAEYEELKVGLVDTRIYVWRVNRTPDDMLNVWRDRYFYFSEEEFADLIEKLSSKLQLPEIESERARHLNKVIRNMISEDSFSQILKKDQKPRLQGDVLHFLRDTLGVNNGYFNGRMEKLASRRGRGPISSPKLLTGKELRHWRAQVGAAVNSDCWLGGDGRMYYHEANRDRIKIFQNQLSQIGDIRLRLQTANERENYRMYLPRPIGKAFIYWGFTTDDKSTQNRRLPKLLRDGSHREWKTYLRNLIPEDGSFNDVAGFQWSRSIVLNPGSQDSKYGLTPQLDSDHVAFIKANGRRDDKRGYIHLQISEKIRSKDRVKSDLTKSFEAVIDANRSKLLDDEANLARNLGIRMRVYPESITLYEGTGRISIKWVATTRDLDNTIKWFLIVPPDDVKKYEHARRWMAKRVDDVERVKKQIESDDLL
ncbi:MAG: hypothetical protein DRP09_15755 [Candidatus Thorarchaeota archaeon]|nr:MAG: hypothetical protein DRP09_15755 [Candidatus Thorarchaeota archaeon]